MMANNAMGGSEADPGHEIDGFNGSLPPSYPFVDPETAYLAYYVQWWRRYYKLVQGAKTAGRPASEIEHLATLERSTRRAVQKGLRAHPLWPWLEQFPGLGGAYTAYILRLIKDPRRFPGQRCEEGHHVPAIFREGAPCPIEKVAESEDRIEQHGAPHPIELRIESEDKAEWCGAPLRNRRGTGVRSLWHYFGLHVIDGKRARKRRGKQADWVTEAPGILLGPQGIADQIIIGRVEPYRSRYDHEKARIAEERGVLDNGDRDGVDGMTEVDGPHGSARSPGKRGESDNGDRDGVEELDEIGHGAGSTRSPSSDNGDRDGVEQKLEIDKPCGSARSPTNCDGSEVEAPNESEASVGLRPVQIHTIARTIAIKAFVGDLLIAWKGLCR